MSRHESAAVSLADALRRATQAEAEVMRLRAGEEPATDHAVCTPGQWIWQWNRAAPEERLKVAARFQDAMTRSAICFMGDHDARLEEARGEIDRLRREAEELANSKELYVRLANSAGADGGRLRDQLRRVRELHRDEYGLCVECTGSHGEPWPCATVRALDEQPAEPSAIITLPQRLTEAEYVALQADWRRVHGGGQAAHRVEPINDKETPDV